VIANADLKGLELHLPPFAVVRDYNGNLVDQMLIWTRLIQRKRPLEAGAALENEVKGPVV
jgi:hypothetical protein